VPSRSPRVCNKPGCGKPTQTPYCDDHTDQQRKQERQQDRESGPRLYDSQRWKRFRKWYLNQPENRICRCGCGRMATEVDHIIPITGIDDRRCFDLSNLQGLTHECHSRKTMREMLSNAKPQ
jgi:5-methylcytosine-specific restriction protein A